MSTITTTITQFVNTPTITDTTTFDTRSENWVNVQLPQFVTETNAVITQVNTVIGEINTAANGVSTNATNAAKSASDASKLAITAHNVTYTLSDGTTTGYSALHYATESSNSASAASGSASTATTQAGNASTSAGNASTSAGNASTSATISSNWAQYATELNSNGTPKGGGAGGYFSSKYWAQYAETVALSGMVFKGDWDASGNIAPSNPLNGNQWLITVGGTFGGKTFVAGDLATYDSTGTKWIKTDNQAFIGGELTAHKDASSGYVGLDSTFRINLLSTSGLNVAHITQSNATAGRTYTLQDASGTVAFTSNIPSTLPTPHSETIKFDGGAAEGIDLYTFDGSAAKTIDIKAGSNITLTKAAGSVTIAATGGGSSQQLTAPSLNSPSDTSINTNIVYTISSIATVGIGTRTVTLSTGASATGDINAGFSSSEGSISKSGTTLVVTGVTSASITITYQISVVQTCSVQAKVSTPSDANYTESNYSAADSITISAITTWGYLYNFNSSNLTNTGYSSTYTATASNLSYDTSGTKIEGAASLLTTGASSISAVIMPINSVTLTGFAVSGLFKKIGGGTSYGYSFQFASGLDINMSWSTSTFYYHHTADDAITVPTGFSTTSLFYLATSWSTSTNSGNEVIYLAQASVSSWANWTLVGYGNPSNNTIPLYKKVGAIAKTSSVTTPSSNALYLAGANFTTASLYNHEVDQLSFSPTAKTDAEVLVEFQRIISLGVSV